MLKPSRLYSFLDSNRRFAVHFFDGQKLIHDLALIHPLAGSGFSYFRDTVLSFMPMIAFLKPGENLGIYIDSEEPYFRLKIETNHAGLTRTLLLPEAFNMFPMKLSGAARVTKQFPNGTAPYTSVIELAEVPTTEVVNKILSQSYQANARVIVSDAADQSFLALKLPPANVDQKLDDDTFDLDTYVQRHRTFFHHVFDDHPNDVEAVVKAFETSSFAYLSSRQVAFHCPCSRERMLDNLRMMFAQDPEALFDGKPTLEARCDYCKKSYEISRDDLRQPITTKPFN